MGKLLSGKFFGKNEKLFTHKKRRSLSSLMVMLCVLCTFLLTIYADYQLVSAQTIYVYNKTNVESWSAVTGTSPSGGCGDVFEFTPSRTGVYRFYSTKQDGDPYIVISDRAIGNPDNYNNYAWTLSESPTYRRIYSLCKYSYEGTDNVAYDDDSNGSLNFNVYVFMEKGHTYDVYATRWSTSRHTTFTTYCSFAGVGNITLNNQGATSAGTTNLYGGRSGFSARVSKNRGYRFTNGANGYGAPISKITLPIKAGYEFMGYYTSTGGSGTRVINADGTINHASLASAFSSNGTVYAYWKPMKQEYGFYNGGVQVAPSVWVQHGSAMPNLSSSYLPSKTGYSFNGYEYGGTLYYNSALTSTVVNYQANAPIIKLNAKWTPNNYKISFNANGGTGSQAATVTYDSAVIDGIAAVPTKTGYDFEGYYTAATGGEKVFALNGYGELEYTKPGKIWQEASDKTYFAHWEPKKYDILLYSSDDVYGVVENPETNERSSGYVTTIADSPYGELELPSAEDLGMVKNHYDFVGWNIYDGQNWSMYAPKTVYRAGLSNEGNTYNADGSRRETVTVQIYAAWTPKDSYSITYNANGGKGAPRNDIAFEGDNYNISPTIPTYENYGFIGWYEAPNGNDETDTHYYVYNADSAHLKPYESDNINKCKLVGITESKTLYARWKKNNSVNYNANGGSFSSALDVIYPAEGDTVDVCLDPKDMPTKVGYEFKGWSETADGPVMYSALGSTSFTMGASKVVLYAVWEINQYEIKYNPVIVGDAVDSVYAITDNGAEIASITTHPASVNHGSTYEFCVSLNKKLCDDTGIRVTVNNVGINPKNTTENGTEVKHTYSVSNAISSQVVSVTGLTQKIYTITYVKNGGDYSIVGAETIDSEYSYAESGKVSLPNMARTGYTFAGWYKDSAFSEMCDLDAITDRYEISKSDAKDHTVYARWTPIEYQVSYDANLSEAGLTGTVPATATVKYDENYTIASSGDLSLNIGGVDIDFIGWNTNKYAVSAEYTVGEGVRNLRENNGDTVTLYAIWNLTQHRVSYDLEGGQGDFESALVYDMTGYTISDVEPTKAGHTFMGWKDQNDTDYAPNAVIPGITEDIVLTAVWEPEKYAVKYTVDPKAYVDAWASDDATIDVDTIKIDSVEYSHPKSVSDNNIEYGSNYTIRDYTQTVTVSQNGLENTSVYFKGWSTTPYTGGTQPAAVYKAGDEVTNLNVAPGADSDGIVQLYAVFGLETAQKNGFVLYDIKDGSWNDPVPSPVEITDSPATYTITSSQPKKTGYTFEGWSVTGNTVVVPAGSNSYSYSGSQYDNVVLRAVYTPVDYTIIYEPNDNYTPGASAGTPEGDATGMAAIEGSKGVHMVVGGTRTIGPAYTLHFDADVNVPKGLMNDSNVAYGTTIALADNEYKSDTYDFMGWSYDPDAVSPEFSDKANVKNLKYDSNNEVKLYAVWVAKSPILRYNANGGEGGPAPVYSSSEAYSNNEVTIADVIPSREGYEFLGWSDSSNATVADYTFSYQNGERVFDQKVAITDTTKTKLIYAVWKKKTVYNIKYQTSIPGAAVPKNITNYYEGDSVDIDVTNTPIKAGYHFVCWKDSADNEYDSTNSTLTVDTGIAAGPGETKEIVLEEVIAPNSYKIDFYYNGVKLDNDGISLKYDESVSGNSIYAAKLAEIEALPEVGSSEGFTFNGWSVIEGASDPVELKNLTPIDNATINVYAIKAATQVDIYLDDDNGSAVHKVEGVKATYGSLMPAINVPAPVKTGYNFAGYYVGDTMVYDEINNAKLLSDFSQDVELKAKWSQKQFHIIYMQDGNVLKSDAVLYKGDNVRIASSKICLDGTVVAGETKLRKWSTTGKLFKENDTSAEPRLFDPATEYTSLDVWCDGGDLILYPVIEPDETYSITYNTNGGAGGPVDANIYEAGDLADIDTTTIPERDNYNFLGWSIYAGAVVPDEGYEKNAECQIKMSKNLTLYAVWQIGTYTINYESNVTDASLIDGNETSIEVVRGNSGEHHMGAIYERDGYELLGWSTSDSTKNSVSYSLNGVISSSLTNASAVSLYTVWAPENYILSFETNTDGELEVDDTVISYDARYGTLPQLSRVGYSFVGWYSNPELTGSKVLSTDVYKNVGNQTLYAKWTNDTYKITYYSNLEDADTNNYVVNNNVLDNVVLYDLDFYETQQINKPGHTLVGYATTRKGSPIYELGQNVGIEWSAKNTNVKLYCIWEANSYKVTFDARGGEEIEPVDYTYGQKYASLPEPERRGYTFLGWYRTKAEDGTLSNKVTTSSVVDITEDTTFYAAWKEENYEIVYYPNYGDKEPISVVYSLAQDVKLKAAEDFETRPGYTLIGYSTTSRGAVVFDLAQSIGDSFGVSGSCLRIYMVWSANEYNVSFAPGAGCDDSFDSIKVVYANKYGELPVPVRSGYTFEGWYSKHNEAAGTYEGLVTADSVVDITEDITLYASWKEEKFEIIYYPNYDNKDGIRTEYSLAQEIKLKTAEDFEPRPGYTLIGYSTTSKGAVVFDAAQSIGDSFVVAGSCLKLYMVWDAKEYTVSFASSAGYDNAFASVKVIYGNKYGELPVPVREGYTFEGWYTKYNAQDDTYEGLVTADSIVAITADHTLYPKFAAYYVVKQKNVIFSEARKEKTDGKLYKIEISDKKIAKMNKKGKITFKKPGHVTIKVTKADKVLIYELDVQLPVVPKKLAMAPGEAKPLDITGVEGLNITYDSSKKSVATVDKDGNIKAISKGRTKITIMINGAKYTTRVTVK